MRSERKLKKISCNWLNNLCNGDGMKETPAECVLAAQATLGEGACWDAETQRLLWLDILGCEVHIFDPQSGKDEVFKTPYHVTLVHPTSRGDLILGTRHGIARMNRHNGDFEAIVDPEKDLPGNRFNDGKPDPMGRLFAGTIPYDGSLGKANLWRFETDFSYTKLLSHVGNSNGLGWSPDETVLYYIDTKTSRVDAFDYDAESGAIENRRPVIEVPSEHGHPDGMTVDAEGCVWTALWGGSGVARWDPSNGELIEKVIAPCPRVTCPSFGGPELDTLYFTTAKQGREGTEPSSEPESGNLFAAQVGVKGLPGYAFKG